MSKKIDAKISGALFKLPEPRKVETLAAEAAPEEMTPEEAALAAANAKREAIKKSLPFRNMRRGASFDLPWGQNVADAILRTPEQQSKKLSSDKLNLIDVNGDPINFPADRVPLWYYILKEAEIIEGGKCLGPVGSRIVGEVFAALLLGDSKSYLSQQPGWKPEDETLVDIPVTNNGQFTVGDFITFAQGN